MISILRQSVGKRDVAAQNGTENTMDGVCNRGGSFKHNGAKKGHSR